MKTYLELIQLPTFEERFAYLQCHGTPSMVTFGEHRMLNQMIYQSPQWRKARREVIIRDEGCDLAIADRPIFKEQRILIHHINPLTLDQVVNHDPCIYDLNNLITVSHNTHEAIHYSDMSILIPSKPTIRTKGDTQLWQTITHGG